MGGTFVGRRQHLRALREASAQRAVDGLMTVVVQGDPGIGKTRLVREFLDGHDEPTVWARCWDDLAVPSLWPWIQVLRALVGEPDAVGLADLDVQGSAGPGAELDVFEQVAGLVRTTSGPDPLTLVIDDLHLADAASVRLLRFLTIALDDLPILLIAITRHHTPPDALREHHGALRARAVVIDVEGLSAGEIRTLVGSSRFTDQLARASGGNALHLRQAMLRTADSEGAAPILYELIRSRLESARTTVREALVAVAVLGRHASADSVAALLGTDVTRTEEHFEELIALGWLEPDSPTPVHPMVSEAALDLAGDGIRAHHARAVEIVTARGASPAEVAHHLDAAGPTHEVEAAAAHLEAAALATRWADHETARDHYAAALRSLLRHPGERRAAFDAAFGLAGAVAAVQGPRAAEPAYADAVRLAGELGDPVLVARAAARHDIEYFLDADRVRERLDTCRAALTDLPAGDSAERVVLTAQLGTAALASIDVDGARRLADDAVDMGRRVGDPWALGRALVAQQVADLGPRTLARRLATAAEVVDLAEAAGTPDLAIHGRFLLKGALLEAGRLQELDSLLPLQRAEIATLGLARFRRHWLWFHAMRAMLEGHAETVEALAVQCGEAAVELDDPDGVGVFFGQLGVARWLQGRLHELEDAYLDQLHNQPDEPLWPAVLGWVSLVSGRHDAARGYLARFADPAGVGSSQHTLLTWFAMGDVVASLGTPEQARRMIEVVEPYGDRIVPIAMGAGVFGTISRVLGSLSIRVGDLPRAERHLRAAIEQTARLPARPFLVDAQLLLARVLMQKGDLVRSRELLGEAAGTVLEHPMPVFEDRITDLRARAASATEAGHKAVSSIPTPRISVLGRFEVIGTDGSPASWSSRRARRLLKMLVAHRGGVVRRDEIYEELWPGEDPATLANRFSVTLRSVRRALDPHQRQPLGAYVTFRDGVVRLRTDEVEVDLEDFIAAANAVIRSEDAPLALVLHALERWTGDPFADEPDADWARPVRASVASTARRLLLMRIDQCAAIGDWAESATRRRQLITLDPLDDAAHLGLVEDLHRAGAASQADQAWRDYLRTMADLGLQAAPDPRGD